MSERGLFRQLEALGSAHKKKLRSRLSLAGPSLDQVQLKGDHAEVALPSLYGIQGALPSFFEDFMQREDVEGSAFRSFLDLFNTPLLACYEQIWRNNHPLSKGFLNSEEAEAKLLDQLSGTLVSPPARPDHVRGQRWNMMALMRKQEATVPGLMSLLKGFFPQFQMEYRGFRGMRRAIPGGQQSLLGKFNATLGRDFLSGSHLFDPAAGFDLFIRNLDLGTFEELLPGGSAREQMATQVIGYTGDRWTCTLTLELLHEEIPSWRLGRPLKLKRHIFLKPPPDGSNAIVFTGELSTQAGATP